VKIRLFIGEAKGIDNGHRSKVTGQRSQVKGQRSKVKGQRSKVKGQRSKMIALKKLNTEKMEKKKKKEK